MHGLDSEEKLQAFRTIYCAIHEGLQSQGYYRHNFLQGHEDLQVDQYIEEIEKHCCQLTNNKQRKYSAVWQAWQLAKKYYHDCSASNDELFNDIYQSVIQQTTHLGKRFFLGTPKVEVLTREKINQKKLSDALIWNIYYQLAYPVPQDEVFPACDLN